MEIKDILPEVDVEAFRQAVANREIGTIENWRFVKSPAMVFEASPATKRIIDKVVKDGERPRLTDLFPGLKKRKP